MCVRAAVGKYGATLRGVDRSMTTYWQALLSAAMMLIGGLKMWLHMGTVPLLSLPTCNGDTITLALGGTSWFERAHCWGCYMFAAGVIVAAFAACAQFAKRRSVAS